MDNKLEEMMLALNARTSLEEALDWDYDVIEYLIGAWSGLSKYSNVELDKDAQVALLAAQLPQKKYEKYQEKLEKWLHDNYNLVVR